MKKVGSLLFLIGIGLFMFSQGTLAQSYPKMRLKFANQLSKKMPPSKPDIFVATQLQKRTNGAVKVKMFHGGTLGNHQEMIDLVGEGAVDIGNFAAAYVFSRLPMEAFYSIPLVYPDVPTLVELGRKGWENSKKMQADHIKNGLYPFNHKGLGIIRILSKKPIRTMADLKGLKIRSFGAVYPKVLSRLGAIPVNMQFHEVYEGLQRGTVDAALTSYGLAAAFKYYEVAKYMSEINLGTDAAGRSYVNLDLYNSWPQNLKDLFGQIVLESEAMGVKVMVGFDQWAKGAMKKAGVKYIPFEDQAKVNQHRDYAIDLTAETIIAQGKEYEKPARAYAAWLKAELKKRN